MEDGKYEKVELLYVRGRLEGRCSKRNVKARSKSKCSRKYFLCHKEGNFKRDYPKERRVGQNSLAMMEGKP